MKGHLTVREISDWLAARKLGDAVDPEIGEHIETCGRCRAAADRADALLDLATSTIVADESLHSSSCPDDIKLSAYADGRLSAEERDSIRSHIEACSVCRMVLRALNEIPAPGRSRGALWLTGFTVLATAAVFSIFFVLGGTQKLDLTVAVLDVDPTRAPGQADFADREFEVRVTVAEAAHLHLLVLDLAGELTLLAEKRVEGEAVFGRYGVLPPEKRNEPLSRRAYALLVSAEESLVNRLDEFEHAPVLLSEDPVKALTQVEELDKRIEEQFDCVVESAPITMVTPSSP
ncbi:MAG: zf-HC2 domain-containing protein [Phycisphaerales bacterium]|nr:zf-HC2 domain-containing protein [Phycisphaerales bacterium]